LEINLDYKEMNMEKTMLGKTVVVTGATSGIGEVTARELAMMGARVWIVGRNPEKTKKTADTINQLGSGQAVPLVGDLSKKADIRRLAKEIQQQADHLDVLVNNAGAFFVRRDVSADGFEMSFALNHMNYFLLTNLLLDLLKSSTPARIVSVSSMAHAAGQVNFDDLQAERHFSGWQTYSNTKLMNVLFTYELSRKLEGTGVTANVLHPGFVASNFGKSNGGILRPLFALSQVAAISPEEGAQTSIYLASSPEVQGVTGKYFTKCKSVKSAPASYDTQVAAKLWLVSEQLTE
jgi:retinol dehydrogenase 12